VAYRGHAFAGVCAPRHLRHVRTRHYTPRTNGKAERFIRTLLSEWAYVRPYTSSRARTAALPRWLHYYNWHRPHTSLDGRPPINRLAVGDNRETSHLGRGQRIVHPGLSFQFLIQAGRVEREDHPATQIVHPSPLG